MTSLGFTDIRQPAAAEPEPATKVNSAVSGVLGQIQAAAAANKVARSLQPKASAIGNISTKTRDPQDEAAPEDEDDAMAESARPMSLCEQASPNTASLAEALVASAAATAEKSRRSQSQRSSSRATGPSAQEAQSQSVERAAAVSRASQAPEFKRRQQQEQWQECGPQQNGEQST